MNPTHAVLISLSVFFFFMIVCDASQKTHVTVVNEIAGDTIKVHCYSGDDDLQYHMLAYMQQLSWSFHINIVGSTMFICTITTKYGFGSYVVYKGSLDTRCGYDCVWKVQKQGPCLKQMNDAPWCQPWQKR